MRYISTLNDRNIPSNYTCSFIIFHQGRPDQDFQITPPPHAEVRSGIILHKAFRQHFHEKRENSLYDAHDNRDQGRAWLIFHQARPKHCHELQDTYSYIYLTLV